MIINNDILKWCEEYQGEKFHALLTDPPYELGFMGKDWDASGIAFNPETWAKLGEHLHDGAFGMAFASSRGWHRLACAIEDAGMRILPSIFGWATGSSFPKATRIPDERFNGHRYGGQSLKNALEPIIVFQKPYRGKPVDCITQTGAGALNIEKSRIGYTGKTDPRTFGGKWKTNKAAKNVYEGGYEGIDQVVSSQGRWASNLILYHQPECGELCVEGCAVLAMDRQSGETVSKAGMRGLQTCGQHGGLAGDNPNYKDGTNSMRGHNDTGTASRFFFQVQTQIDESDPVIYEAKASSSERDSTLDRQKSNHPTHKPINLTKYLATLLLPPDEYAPRRILVPFSGVGSEMIGALLAGWEEVVGIELDAEYCEIAEKRIKFYLRQPTLF